MDKDVEIRRSAYEFIRQHLPFLDRNWLQDTLDRKLTELLTQTVKDHTSAGDNTANLRAAVLKSAEWAEVILQRLPSSAKKCVCRDLDNGEHAPQPMCHHCLLTMLIPDMRGVLKGDALTVGPCVSPQREEKP